MNYCKITTEGKAMIMPNPIRLVIANPTEEIKKTVAELDGWLPAVCAEEPEYNSDTEYITDHWEEREIDGIRCALQVWDVLEIGTENGNDE